MFCDQRIVAIQTDDTAEHLRILRLDNVETRRLARELAVAVVHAELLSLCAHPGQLIHQFGHFKPAYPDAENVVQPSGMRNVECLAKLIQHG